MLYSKLTGGFYSADIHGDNIPSDAVAITTEEHQALISGQSNGKMIAADADGKPFLTDIPAPTTEALAASVRVQRDALLSACDWFVTKAFETGTPVPEVQAAYRQALRDVTQQSGFPESFNWPVAP